MTGESNDDAVIAITGRGMVSSLGDDVVTACGAARAGLVRLQPLEIRMQSPEDGEADYLKGHPAGELTRGFEGFARLLRLMTAGLRDLLKQTPGGPWRSSRTGVYLSLPDPYRIHTGLQLIMDDATRRDCEEEAREAFSEPKPDLAAKLLRAAAQLASWPIEPSLRFSTTSGHAGVAEMTQMASEDLRSGRVEAAVVGGVDSLLEEEMIVWLHNTGRLKRAGIPVGLLPGEAGAFVLFEMLSRDTVRENRPMPIFQSAQLEDEDGTLLSGTPARGVALASALAKVMDAASPRQPRATWVLSDHNGELYRATEWGHAQVKLARRYPELGSPLVWYPASSFGDVGAASGAVALCLVAHAFNRGCAPAQSVIVASSSEDARRAGMLICGPEAWRACS